jgi:oxaloacetate decarboxylase alpha subunit
MAAAPAAAATPAPAAAPAAAPASGRPASWVAVESPMVGTFYAASAPDQPPFVAVGDEVMAGSTLCIVEAMKLMNEIPADFMCVVREVCVENAQPVEFGQALFYVEPVDSQKAGE